MMIDVHCHLEYMKNPEEVMKGVRERQMKIITSVASIEHTSLVLDYREKNQGFVFVSLGLHPSNAVKISEKELSNYFQFIVDNREKIVAIGEIGLDYKLVKPADVEKTKQVFRQMIELANSLSLPIFIHSRNSTSDCLEILKAAKVPVILHNFTGNMTELAEALGRGYFISVGTNVASSKNMKKAAKRVPAERLLLETDSPWNDPYAKEPGVLSNVPWNIEFSAEFIAKLRETTKEDILRQTEENAVRLFGLEE